MASWATPAKTLAIACALATSGPLAAATIYGTIQEGNQPLSTTPVVLSCSGAEATTNTDQRGNYRLTLNRTGRCILKVGGGSAQVAVYDDPTRYNFEIARSGGQIRLIAR